MNNNVAGYNLNGIQDTSGAVPIPDPETTPQHLPLAMLLCEKGKPEPIIASLNTASSSFGARTLDLTSPYATAATVLTNTIIATGNQVMLRRLVPAGATTAFLRIAAELIAAQVPIYTRNLDGTIQLNSQGQPVTTGNQNGWRIVWHVNPAAMSSAAYGEATPIASFRPSTTVAGSSSLTLGGIMDNSQTPAVLVATSSTLYPVLDIPVAQGPGAYGNSYGLQIQAPLTSSRQPTNQILSQNIKSFLYRLSVATIPHGLSSATVRQTLTGASYVDVALKPNQTDPRANNRNCSLNNGFVDAYRQLDVPGLPDVDGYFDDVFQYDAYIQTILTTVATTSTVNTVAIPGEGSFDAAATAYGRTSPYYLADPANLYQLNIFTGTDVNGAPYYALDVANSALFGGVSFGAQTTVFATGGDDGLAVDATGTPDPLANWQILDELTRAELATFGTGEIQWFDALRYPITTIWDPGYCLDTKKAMINPMSLVKYIYIVMATQSIADYDTSTPPKFVYSQINTAATDIAIATELQSFASLAPESELYGTPACRAFIMGQAAKLLTGWRTPLPLTLEMAKKVGTYMGAGDGKWKNGKNFTESPLNQVTLFGRLNYQWMPAPARAQAWGVGMINAQSAGRSNTFFAALRSIYPDDTSVLNSWTMVAACCYAELVAIRSWALLSGITGLTQKQFAARSNAIISAQLDEAFDGQFTVVPNTYFTAQDTNNNNSWTCKINFYANGMLVLGDFTIVANRYAALLAQAA